MLVLEPATKACMFVRALMRVHYSQPRGFVGRQLVYRIRFNDELYGAIVFGSAVKHLPGRRVIGSLNNGLNNTFFHIFKVRDRYPLRNFVPFVLLAAEAEATQHYARKYGDSVFWLESLVELPRTGDLYKRAGYQEVGLTKGYCCKRIAGASTDTWTGRRVWTVGTQKRVFQKILVATPEPSPGSSLPHQILRPRPNPAVRHVEPAVRMRRARVFVVASQSETIDGPPIHPTEPGSELGAGQELRLRQR